MYSYQFSSSQKIFNMFPNKSRDVEETVELLVIKDSMALIWRHSGT